MWSRVRALVSIIFSIDTARERYLINSEIPKLLYLFLAKILSLTTLFLVIAVLSTVLRKLADTSLRSDSQLAISSVIVIADVIAIGNVIWFGVRILNETIHVVRKIATDS